MAHPHRIIVLHTNCFPSIKIDTILWEQWFPIMEWSRKHGRFFLRVERYPYLWLRYFLPSREYFMGFRCKVQTSDPICLHSSMLWCNKIRCPVSATNGTRILDREFHRNWEECSGKSFLRGAYHYYRPSQNSNSQFDLFKTHVYLRKGDLPPMLDVEENSLLGRENLLRGVKNWLKLAEDHYGIKPIIYTNLDFYRRYFDSKEFKSYHFWIAAYSGRHRIASVPWTFHQFSEKMRVKGISELVDGNDFNGDRRALERLCIK